MRLLIRWCAQSITPHTRCCLNTVLSGVRTFLPPFRLFTELLGGALSCQIVFFIILYDFQISIRSVTYITTIQWDVTTPTQKPSQTSWKANKAFSLECNMKISTARTQSMLFVEQKEIPTENQRRGTKIPQVLEAELSHPEPRNQVVSRTCLTSHTSLRQKFFQFIPQWDYDWRLWLFFYLLRRL